MSDSAHPLLPAATPLLQAGAAAGVQAGGVDGGSGLLLEADDAAMVALLRGLDGRRGQRAVIRDAARLGLDPRHVAEVLDGLRDSGLLVDLDAGDLLSATAGPAASARTAPELPAALGRPGGWRARRRSVVVVEGATRVGAPLAAMLAASGVGRVTVRDSGLTTAGDAVVGGLTAADEGRPRALAAADAVRRASPLTDLRPLEPGIDADLVVLARPWAACDPLVAGFHRSGVPHLVATVRGETGVVGPLVVPGMTSCLHCADLHRRDADPRWPRLAAQLTAREPPPSGSTVTCLLTAATAALQALAYLDGSAAPGVLEATVELRPPHLAPRLRRWPVHPGCSCGAAREEATATPAGGPTARSGDAVTAPAGADRPREGTMGG
ncbi:ThiF family adenylyltransferase [Blastococcus tunisiensis]|uniref:ThiF family protein n=1 Tax=Blastococcus tunisiensis TaxID=1798228 RepID=A0A1I2CC05_9ACTN|nr:ThiF family adenylyltransferase [Blastococcus sp. DSM 46838]SFE65732.1 ThiF family protein [Blastococcus sp. DSM 46838]